MEINPPTIPHSAELHAADGEPPSDSMGLFENKKRKKRRENLTQKKEREEAPSLQGGGRGARKQTRSRPGRKTKAAAFRIRSERRRSISVQETRRPVLKTHTLSVSVRVCVFTLGDFETS